MVKKYLFSLLFFSFSVLSYSQVNTPGGVTCGDAGPICADNTGSFIFQNNNDASTNINTPVACLLAAPRPAWFFFRVDQTGDLIFDIIQTSTGGAGLDVDFVVWGPFANDSGECNNVNINCATCPFDNSNTNYYLNDLDNSNIVDCSYSADSIESMTLPNAISGEFYLLLVSNFAGGNGTIEIVQTNFGTPGGGSTDCTIINVDGILGPDQNICDMSSVNLDANPTNDPDFVDYTWEFDDGTGFSPIAGTDGFPSISVSNTGQYQVTITDNLGNSDSDIIEIVVTDIPTVNTIDPQQYRCDDNNDGIWNFDFTLLDATIIGTQTDVEVSYHNTLNDAEMDMNPITGLYPNATAYTAEPIFIRIESTINRDCASTGSFEIDVFETPILSTSLDATVCSDDPTAIILDLDVGDVASTTYNITAINTNGLVASAGAPVLGTGFGANEISDDAYMNMTNAPVIVTYTIVPVSADNCNGNPFDINVTINPAPAPDLGPHEIRVCDDDSTQFLVELFDLTQLEADIFDGNLGLSAVYFRTLQEAIDRLNGIPDPENYPNIDPVETIYVRVENSFDCFTIVEIEIEVYPLPDASVDVTDWLVCENDTDFLFDFELNSKIPEILGPNQSEADFEVTFYSTQIAADNEDPTFLLDGISHQNVGNPQPIFVVITNRTTGCTISEQTFNIEVQDGADAFDVFYEECDVIGDNDGSTQFDLETQIPLILGPNQTLADFSVDFYADFDDAEDGNSNILPLLYENFVNTNPQIIYARVSNVLSPEDCFDIAEITLQTNLLPIFDLDDSYTLCLTSNSEAEVPIPPVIDTELSETNYTFEWRFNGDILTAETGSSLIPTQGGTYSVLVTDSTVTMCTNFDETIVVEGGIPDPNTFDIDVVSQTFTGNNMIVATATGNSEYEFSLDNGPWQLSGEFENVTGGDHVVAVRDVLGCGILYENITVIDYPKFFTPNGDGNNDTWTIKGIDSQPSAVIYIHDRFGKLLKQLSPTSPGWDGTYNGNRMPSSDYWFTLEYTEPINDEKRTFSAHFALKR